MPLVSVLTVVLHIDVPMIQVNEHEMYMAVEWGISCIFSVIVDALQESSYLKDFCKTNKIKTIKNCIDGWRRFIQITNQVDGVQRVSNFGSQAAIKIPYDAFLLFKKDNKRSWYDVIAQDIAYFVLAPAREL